MELLYLILKWFSQILIVTGGVLSLLREPSIKNANTGKKSLTNVGILIIVTLSIGFGLFIVTDIKERADNRQKLALQETTISELRQLNRLNLDRDLREIQISFKTSPDQSTRIAEAYGKIPSTSPPIPYSAATMRAERINDRWKIEFDPVLVPEGTIKFAPVYSDQPKGKGFDDVLREASLPLWIKWDAGNPTELEPRQNHFPSAMVVAGDTVTLILRPPLVELNLNYLKDKPTFLLRGDGKTKSLTIRSQDPALTFEQVIDLNWQNDPGPDNDPELYIKRTKPYLSGPHRLQINFRAG